jgi:predicted RNA binding protein YcfA (HicA-like mRNA interferase family)
MSEHLPNISGKECVKALQEKGWYVTRQKGSHIMMKKDGERYTLAVPRHTTLGKGLLSQLLADAGITVEDFRRLL